MAAPTFTQFTNPPYQPTFRFISAITNANPALVTTSIPHGYQTGIIARLYIPNGFGMVQANQLFAPITVLNATQFTIALDTQLFDVFANPGTNLRQTAMVVPIGEITSSLLQPFDNKLPNATPFISEPVIPVPPSFIGYPQDTLG